MTRGPAIPCPRCKRAFEELAWIDSNHISCRRCFADFDFLPYPALTRNREISKPQAVAVAEDSTCFFHTENRADKICDGCGRFLCNVCAVPFAAQTLCPACIAGKKSGGAGGNPEIVNDRTVYDTMALSLAVVPVVFGIVLWWVTPITAPAALCVIFFGWKKPRSLVSSSRWKAIVAGVLALLQIGGWCYLGLQIYLS